MSTHQHEPTTAAPTGAAVLYVRQSIPAAVYSRISRDAGNDETGVRRQERLAKQWCEDNDRAVAGIYRDNDMSGSNRKVRPEFERLLADIEAGYVKHVVVYAVDRLTRSVTTLERLIDVLERNQCTVTTLTTGAPLDLSSASGRMTTRILGTVAQYEREAMLARLADQKREQAEDGCWFGGAAPFGYDNARKADGKPTLVVNEAEAVYVRQWCKDVAGGKTLRAIEADMHASGVPPLRGTRWRYGSIRNLIINPTIAGYQLWKGKVIGTGNWLPLVDPSEWEEARAILTDPTRKHRSPHKYLLTGMVVAEDGTPARTKPTKVAGGVLPCYVVVGGSVPADVVEELAKQVLFDQLAANTVPLPTTDDRRAADHAAVKSLDAELKQLTALRNLPADDLDRLTLAEYQELARPLRARKNELAERLSKRAATPNAEVLALLSAPETIVPDDFDLYPFAVRRALLSAAVLKVVVYPRGSATRVRVVPRSEESC